MSPANGDTVDPAVINAQGYIEVSFLDAGDGVDISTIDGDELSLSGSGVGTVVLSDSPTLVSGSIFRYGFTGEFVEGAVNVDFVAGSFADQAGTQNLNTLKTESFTVSASPPAPTIQIIDDGDTGFATVGDWSNYDGSGYETDVKYNFAGSGSEVASWTFGNLVPGTYEVSVHWSTHPNRASNAPYTVFDGASQVGGAVVVDQKVKPASDYLEKRRPFQVLFGAVTINNGTLVVELTDAGDGVVIADAVRIELVAPSGPDITPPTANLMSPANGDSIDPAVLNAQGYLEVSFSDIGESPDSDGDGVADHKDLFPEDADFARVSDYVDFIIDYLVDDRVIFDEDWKELQNEAEFTAELEAVLDLVLAAEQAQDAEWAALLYIEALGIIDDELLIRTDGFQEGGSHETDWIIIKEAQDIVYPDLLLLSEYLWLSAH